MLISNAKYYYLNQTEAIAKLIKKYCIMAQKWPKTFRKRITTEQKKNI